MDRHFSLDPRVRTGVGSGGRGVEEWTFFFPIILVTITVTIVMVVVVVVGEEVCTHWSTVM